MKTLSFIKKTLPLALFCASFTLHGMYEKYDMTKLAIFLENNTAPKSWAQLPYEDLNNILREAAKQKKLNLKDSYGNNLYLGYLQKTISEYLRDSDANHPLNRANSAKFHLEDINWWLSHECDIMSQNNEKENALMMLAHVAGQHFFSSRSVREYFYYLIKKLKGHYSSELLIKGKNNNGQTILMIDIASKEQEPLFDYGNISQYIHELDNNGLSIADYAILYNKKFEKNIIKAMIKQKVKLPSLKIAIEKNFTEKLEILLDFNILPTDDEITLAKQNNTLLANYLQTIRDYLVYNQDDIKTFIEKTNANVWPRLLRLAIIHKHTKTLDYFLTTESMQAFYAIIDFCKDKYDCMQEHMDVALEHAISWLKPRQEFITYYIDSKNNMNTSSLTYVKNQIYAAYYYHKYLSEIERPLAALYSNLCTQKDDPFAKKVMEQFDKKFTLKDTTKNIELRDEK